MTDTAFEDRPRTFIHPPTAFYISLIVGFVLRVSFGGHMPLPRALAEGVGGVLILVAIALLTAAIRSFAEGGETLKPDTPSQQLFINGVYRFSRNPIYLAMMLFGFGFAVATSNIWIILTTIITGLCFQFFVIKPEERYLEDRFGEEYLDYKNRVRRWI